MNARMNDGFEKLASREMSRRDSQKRAMEEIARENTPGPIITISRDYYGGGETFAREVSARLGWKLYNKEIVESIAKNRKTATESVELADEQFCNSIQAWTNEIFLPGYVGNAAYMKGLVRTMLSIAEEGSAVVVGRGANFLLPSHRRLATRFTAPLDWRISNYSRMVGTTAAVARKAVTDEDLRRQEFIRQNFRKELTDPLHYDLVINTSCVELNDALDLVLELFGRRFATESKVVAV